MNPSQHVLVNGNEAVAWGALCAGATYFSHYPGSPVNSVEPAIKRLTKQLGADVTFNDALNEHVAALSCAGASYCGARSMVVMKHVGVNIAADPFNYLGYTGIVGGMVIIVGTDPGANSSTGEEDVHWYAPQFNFPLLEPASVQDIFSYVRLAFDLSEENQLPVLIFIPGRLCHNSDSIEVPRQLKNHVNNHQLRFERDNTKYINVGSRAIRNHRLLLERVTALKQDADLTQTHFNPDAKLGLITRGLTFGHVFESVLRLELSQAVHLLNLGMVFPIHHQIIEEFLQGKEAVTIIEDQDGFLEFQIKARFFNHRHCPITGKEHFPQYGEVEFDQVCNYLSQRFGIAVKSKSLTHTPEPVPERLGTFCEGCPHRGSFFAIEQALEGRDGVIGGDIGCSSLPPFRADWLMCMNAGIGISQGMSHVVSGQTVISTGGESTFFHGGLISLHSAALNNINLLHSVFDNRVIGMTGRQSSPTTHHTLNYRKLLKSIGVKRVSVVSAYKPTRFIRVLKREMHQTGVRVIWVNTPCARTPSLITALKRMVLIPYIDTARCGDCTLCFDQLACPAIGYPNGEDHRLQIDTTRCMRCGTCRDICPHNAIRSNFAAPRPGLLYAAGKEIIQHAKGGAA